MYVYIYIYIHTLYTIYTSLSLYIYIYIYMYQEEKTRWQAVRITARCQSLKLSCYTMLCYAMLMLCYAILHYTLLYYTILFYTILSALKQIPDKNTMWEKRLSNHQTGGWRARLCLQIAGQRLASEECLFHR